MFTVPTGTNIWKAENPAKTFQNSSHKTTSFHLIDWEEMLYTVDIMFVDSVYGLNAKKNRWEHN